MSHLPLLRHPLLMAGSLALNVMLGCAGVALWVQSGKTPPQTAAVAVVASAGVKSHPLVVKTTPPKPFHWSQLETPDFASYVKNLRGVGCPEATIRDIVAGELNEIHAEKRKAMVTSSGALRAAEEMKLQAEYEQLLTKLTAPAASSEQASHGSTAAANEQAGPGAAPTAGTLANSTPSASPAADIPAAFTYGSSGFVVMQEGSQNLLSTPAPDPTLSPVATTALQQMQNDFAQAVGATNAPSDSPAYRIRWNQIRRDSDERFSSMFGGDLFIQTQSEAARAAAAPGAP